MNNLPKAIAFPRFQSITAYSDDGEEEGESSIGDIAEQYLRKLVSASGTDKTFGLRDEDGKFYFLIFNLFIRHIHYYRHNVQLKTDIIRMARSYMATIRGALKVCLK